MSLLLREITLERPDSLQPITSFDGAKLRFAPLRMLLTESANALSGHEVVVEGGGSRQLITSRDMKSLISTQ